MRAHPDQRDPDIRVHDDASAATAAAAALIAEWIAACGDRPVHLALAGGTTPGATYRRLAELVPDWRHIHLWFGDERMVAPGSPDANAHLIAQTLLAHAPIPPDHVHRVPTHLDVAAAAARYGAELGALAPCDPDGVPRLDIALLGLGEDGHVASLFPDRATLAATGICLPVTDAPKPPPRRVTLSLTVLNRAEHRLVLTTGAGKAPALAAALAEPDPHVPASLLTARGTTIVTDRAAAAGVSPPSG